MTGAIIAGAYAPVRPRRCTKVHKASRLEHELRRAGLAVDAPLVSLDGSEREQMGEGVAETDIPAEVHRREGRLPRIT